MFNLHTFRELVTAALWSGLLAGLLLTGIQQIQVIPTLLKAEVYEQQAAVIASTQTVLSHEHNDWQPENGLERTLYTAMTNISLGVGFALLMGSIMLVRGRPEQWRSGLVWGLAGYLSIFVAPSLGLPPEVPGTAAANLEERQTWWLLTVFDTGFGLWLLAFAKTRTNQFFGAVLLAAPHLIGAPHSEVPSSAAPAELIKTFITATVYANAVFWLALGGLMGRFYKKH